MAKIGRQNVSSRQVPNLRQKKSIFERDNFPQPSQKATATSTTIDLSDYPQPRPKDLIANVMRSLSTSKSSSPPDYLTGKPLAAPKRQEREANLAPINPLKAPPRLSIPMGGVVQTKLTIGRPDDRYEQEADRVAAKVVQQINRPAPVSPVQGEVVQGKEEGLRMKPMPAITELEAMPEEGDLRMVPMVQRREVIGGGEASTELSGEINRARGSGQLLDPGLQQSMGQAMGADFSGVRVHTDERADRLNRVLSARAFTTGQDLFFKKGEYRPGSREGRLLIAHELTHAKQQEGEAPTMRRWPDPETTFTTREELYETFFCHNAVVFWLLCDITGSQHLADRVILSFEEEQGKYEDDKERELLHSGVVAKMLGYRDGEEVRWKYEVTDEKLVMSNVKRGDIVFWGGYEFPGHSMVYISPKEMRGFNNLGTVVKAGAEMKWGEGKMDTSVDITKVPVKLDDEQRYKYGYFRQDVLWVITYEKARRNLLRWVKQNSPIWRWEWEYDKEIYGYP